MEGTVSRLDTELGRRCELLGVVLSLVSLLDRTSGMCSCGVAARPEGELRMHTMYTGKEGADYSYNMIKKRMQGDNPNYRTSSGQHLLAAAEASK